MSGAADCTARASDLDRRLHRLPKANALEHGMNAITVGEARTRSTARAVERFCECDSAGMAAQEDDPRRRRDGSSPSRRKHEQRRRQRVNYCRVAYAIATEMGRLPPGLLKFAHQANIGCGDLPNVVGTDRRWIGATSPEPQ
jgi:hypothetical protein